MPLKTGIPVLQGGEDVNLPYDYSRCTGRLLPDSTLHADCINCLRRTSPGRPEYQVYTLAPPLAGERCPSRIES